MGLYCKFQQVKLRLIGKVRFTENEEDGNLMPIALANRLISEAEGQVEMDLSPRYMAPFQTIEGAPYSSLPVRPTQEVIRTLAELQSVIRILETDFGSGTPVDGENYAKKLRERYKEILDNILALKDGSYQTWKLPPLPGLRLNWNNMACDDGYAGTAYNTSEGVGDYAAQQINQPSANWWNVSWSDVEAL